MSHGIRAKLKIKKEKVKAGQGIAAIVLKASTGLFGSSFESFVEFGDEPWVRAKLKIKKEKVKAGQGITENMLKAWTGLSPEFL